MAMRACVDYECMQGLQLTAVGVTILRSITFEFSKAANQKKLVHYAAAQELDKHPHLNSQGGKRWPEDGGIWAHLYIPCGLSHF